MKSQPTSIVSVFAFVLGLALFVSSASGQTDFSWHGWLVDGTTLLEGRYDLRLRLFDAPQGGSKLGNDVFKQDVTVSYGAFSGTLDFGVDIFDGLIRYVEIAFRLGSLNDPYPYKVLSAPRQEVLRTHHTILAEMIGIGTSNPDADLVVQSSEGSEPVSQVKVMSGPSRFALRAMAGRSSCVLTANYSNDDYGEGYLDDETLAGWDLAISPIDDSFRIIRAAPQANPVSHVDTLVKVSAQGNVGIGTTQPSAPLHVYRPNMGLQLLTGSSKSSYTASLGVNDDGVNFSNNSSSRGYNFRNASGTLMTISSGGYVGIGTDSPAAKLDVTGTIRCTSLQQTSDARFKTNVAELTNALAKIEKIRGVSFEWNDRAESVGAQAGQREIGVVAQEVESVFPELVASSAEGYKSVDYTKLTAVLIEAVKELKTENDSLRSRLRALEVSLDRN